MKTVIDEPDLLFKMAAFMTLTLGNNRLGKSLKNSTFLHK